MAYRRRRARALIGAAVVVVVGSALVAPTMSWGDATIALSGEGGSFSKPMLDLLSNDSAALSAIAPFVPSFFDADIDQAATDFAMASTDYAVTEIPLTASDAATAAQNGRSFAYVPLAASPVALAAVVECSGLATNPFCPGLELTLPLLARIFTNLPPGPNVGIGGWNNPALVALAPSLSGLLGGSTVIHALDDVQPSVVNLTLESLFEGNSTTKPIWDAYLQLYNHTTDDTPTDLWPNTPDTVSGGEGAIAQLLAPFNQNVNPPVPKPVIEWGQGSIAAMSPGWIGPPANIPTVAIQNAADAFVQPTAAAMTAALQDATMDPTTNLVTFHASTTDTAAYPIPVMTYLVAPTTGLDPAKATALAGFIRFLLGSAAQKDIETLGSIPPTQAMITAGLHVADEVAAEATAATTTTTATSTTTTSPGATTSTTAASAGQGSGATGAATASTTTAAPDSGPSLAFTGGVPWPVPLAGTVLVFVGLTNRRVLRLRLARRGETP